MLPPPVSPRPLHPCSSNPRLLLTRRGLGALLAPAALTACGSPPDVDRLLATVRPDDLHAAPGDTENALQAQYALQAALRDSPLVFGNRTTLLRTAQDALAAMFAAIRDARDHVNLEYFIFADVEHDGVHLSELLLSRLRAGVQVNMIYDAFGSKGTPGEFFDTLRKAGAQVLQFNPLDPLAGHVPWAPNARDHRKLMVIDGRIAITGGTNLDTVYENPRAAGIPANGDTDRAFWLDIAIRIEGPAVAEVQKLFFGTWREQKGPDVAAARYFPPLERQGVQTIRIIGSSPGNARPLYYVSLIAAVRAARTRVWAASGYFVPPHQERETLRDAARAGADVRLVLPSHSDVRDAVFAGRAAYGDLLEAGTRIWEVDDAVLHSKLVVIDGVWTAIGSSNLDRRSVAFNNEIDVIILGKDTAAQAEALLSGYAKGSSEVTLAAWRERPMSERLQEIRARVWQYWM